MQTFLFWWITGRNGVGPCKMIGPIVEEIAEEYGDKLKVTKLDIDSNNMTPRQYGIRGIPTLMIFRDGNVQATKVGALTKGQLKAVRR